VAKIHYTADGPIAAERFIAALTDFGERRPELWPNLDTKFFRLHERGDTWAEVTEGTDILGGVWARERYDWSEPGIVRLRLLESADFRPGTVIEYRVAPNADGGCHVEVDFQRIARSLRGRIVGLLVQLAGPRRFSADLRATFERLARLDA
jgi:Polyketide cyclase / dehydrase and lipid transport